MAETRCLLVGVIVLKIIVVGAAETAPESQWTHKDTAASTGMTMTDGRNVISPRMDFEEWTPLGRGDPLKNDPTFDYLPPVLDRVHYWKSPPAATNRAHYYSSSVSTATPTTPPSQAVHGGYNRRFFLTDFSKREPVQAASYAPIKRPPLNNNILQPHHHHPHNHHHAQQQQMQHHLHTLQAVSAAGYHYSMHPAAPVPRTPLPMLTPPPYQQWPAAVDGQRQSLSSSSPDLPGNTVAESKQPPPTMVRAPTRLVPPSSQSAVIKALLDDEVDRTTVTTTGTPITGAVWMTTMMTTTTTTSTTPPPPPPPPSLTTTTTTAPTTPPATSTAARTTPQAAVTDPLFAHYRQSPVTGRPMYLIIQGHSKVKTYGLASKLDDLTAAPVVQDHNHIGGTVDGVAKQWTPNVDFEAPRNWDAGHVPSPVDVAVFQKDTLVPVVVPAAGVDVCEVVLPFNGQLILEPNARVVISASSEAMGGCTGQDVTFKQNAPMEWVDPENWSMENFNIATPHVERIPCVHDTVVFNPGHSFSVIVPDVPINIGSMKFGNQTFGQTELNEFLLSDVGDQELKSFSPDNDVSITLTSTSCEVHTGCECGTQQLFDQVCKVASKRCDSKLGCLSPVKPIGHCCWTCGAYFLINYNPNDFTIEQFSKEFENDMSKLKPTFEKHQLSYYMSKLLNGKVQVVMVSSTKYVDEINEIAKTIHSLLITYQGVTDVKIFNSGLAYDADGMTYGQIALTTCIVIFCSMLAIILYYNNDWKSLLSGSGSSAGAVFVKFKNDTNEAVELIDEDVRLQRKTSFDNPTYGAVESMNKSKAFRKMHSYSDLSVLTTPSEAMDVELQETGEQKS